MDNFWLGERSVEEAFIQASCLKNIMSKCLLVHMSNNIKRLEVADNRIIRLIGL